ncbi:MAG: trigger factor [Solirubrobacterales bacterium]|nr:trigger factor [Solirubrobacterales bacterium]
MATAVKTTTTELPESRVRVDAEVGAGEVERSLQAAARQLGRDLRIPGFRQGKVPPPVVIQRIGREAVLDEAVRGGLPRWYIEAIDQAGVVPVGDPKLDVGDLPDRGEPLTFTIEIGVRPTATLGSYRDLEVGRAEARIDEEAVDAELEEMRERLARLEPIDRAAQSGDFVTIDFVGSFAGEPFPGGEGRDQLVELGAGRLVPGFEEQLEGVAAGDERTVEVTFPDDYGVEALRGRAASFAVTVKDVRAKELPALDDDLAEQNGFDSLAELREDVGSRAREADERRVDAEFREAVLDAAVAQAQVEVPEALVRARTHELWDRLLHSLEHQGVSRDDYLRIAEKSEPDILEEAAPDAERQLRREAVIEAIAVAEGIEVSDDELLAALEPTAQREGTTPKALRDRLRSQGRLDDLAGDVRARKAIDVVAESARPIPVEQAQAREKLWTPDREEQVPGQPAGGLWTPGS